jgi:hypothetical protein
MDLLNELGADLALAFLVEKKHTEKIDSKDVRVLIAKVRKVLQPVSIEPQPPESNLSGKKNIAVSC